MRGVVDGDMLKRRRRMSPVNGPLTGGVEPPYRMSNRSN